MNFLLVSQISINPSFPPWCDVKTTARQADTRQGDFATDFVLRENLHTGMSRWQYNISQWNKIDIDYLPIGHDLLNYLF